jgi:hypothetical protein
VKIILGVGGKSHHILNKIYEDNNNYLIYLSCGDEKIQDKWGKSK